MSSSWKDKFLPPKGITHEVSGVDHVFYPVSVNCAVKLKTLGGPLINALSTLFAKGRRANDTKQTHRTFEENGVSGAETICDEISPEIAKLRDDQTTEAIETALETVTAKENIAIIGDLILDSMRELFPSGDPSNPPGIEIATWFNIVQMREVLVGVAKANAEVFGPLASQVTQAVESALQRTPGTTLTAQSSN